MFVLLASTIPKTPKYRLRLNLDTGLSSWVGVLSSG